MRMVVNAAPSVDGSSRNLRRGTYAAIRGPPHNDSVDCRSDERALSGWQHATRQASSQVQLTTPVEWSATMSPAGRPPRSLALYEALVATQPELERRSATSPYTSVNGNMFSSQLLAETDEFAAHF